MPHLESTHLKTAYFSGVEINLDLVYIFVRFGGCLNGGCDKTQIFFLLENYFLPNDLPKNL